MQNAKVKMNNNNEKLKIIFKFLSIILHFKFIIHFAFCILHFKTVLLNYTLA